MSEELDENTEVESEATESPNLEAETVKEQVGEYTPDYSYKFKDEERSFDDRLHSVVKDKDTEEYFRDLYTRADGLDAYKQKYAEVEGNLNSTTERMETLTGGYEKLRDLRESGEFRELFDVLGLSDDKIMDYALGLAEEEELPEEQRALVKQNRELEARLSAIESQNSSMSQAEKDREIKADLEELQGVCNKEEFRDVTEALAKSGQSFFEDVKQTGIHIYNNEGREPTFEEVANLVASKYRGFLQPVQQEQQQQLKVVERQPTIPSVKANNSAPVGETITSIDELRKLASQIPNR